MPLHYDVEALVLFGDTQIACALLSELDKDLPQCPVCVTIHNQYDRCAY